LKLLESSRKVDCPGPGIGGIETLFGSLIVCDNQYVSVGEIIMLKLVLAIVPGYLAMGSVEHGTKAL
jgi:hypothetical protein